MLAPIKYTEKDMSSGSERQSYNSKDRNNNWLNGYFSSVHLKKL